MLENTNSEGAEKRDFVISKRPATNADTEFARKVHHLAFHDVIVRQFGVFDEATQDEYFFKIWNPEFYQILSCDDIEAGYLCVMYLEDSILAHEMVLLPEFQGKKIGSTVLKELIEESETKNIPIRLQVLRENVAQNLYTRLGFEEYESDEKHIKMIFFPNGSSAIKLEE